MKKSLNLFSKKHARRRQREDNFIDYDEEYEEDQYEDEDYDDGYDDEDYPDEEFEEEYGQDEEEDRYEEDVEGEEDYPDDDRYEDEEYSDRDYESDEDYDIDYEPERDERYEAEEYPEDDVEEDRYEDDEYPEDDVEDDRYEDDEYSDADYESEDDYDYDEEYDRDVDDDYDRDYDDRDYDRRRGAYGDSGRRGGRRDRDRHHGESAGARILEFIRNTSVAERAAAVVALLLVIGAVVTLSFYSKAKDHVAEIGSFAEVGADFQIEDAVGSSGLLAIADAEMARAMTAGIVEEEFEEEEEEVVPDTDENVTIKMTLTSIKSDIKIKFINSETSKLVANVHFTVSVVNPDGSKIEYDDHDMDGIIYKNNMTAGTYKITPNALSSEYEKYKLDTSTKSLTVKDTVEMKAVDVSNEIKKESQVNAAKEDTAVQEVVESVLTDTVEWVDSNQNSKSSDGSTYEKVEKSKVEGLILGAVLRSGSVRRMAAARTGNVEDPKPDGQPEDPSNTDSGNTDSGNSGSSNTDPGNPDPPQPSIEPLALSGSSLEIEEGQSKSVTASGNIEDLKAETGNSSCATAEVSGSSITVNGVSAGSTTITVSSKGGSKTINVTVTKKEVPQPTQISIDKASLSLKSGETGTVTVMVGPSNVSCESSNTGVATVTSNGKTITVTAVGKGSAKITVKGGDDYLPASFDVEVSEVIKTMTLDKESITIKKGEEAKIVVTGPSKIDSCTPNKSGVANVTINGNTIIVKGTAVDSAEFAVAATGFGSKTFTVTVNAADKKDMKVSPADKAFSLKLKEEKAISITEPANITVETDKKDIVAVDKSGTTYKITAKNAGTVNITFKGGDDYNPHVVAVTVAAAGELKLKATKVTLVPGKSYKLECTDTAIKPTFESSNKAVATVDEDGKIKAVAAGDATITAKYGDKTATAAVKVVAGETALKDKDGNDLYVLQSDGTYRKATYADYYNSDVPCFYLKKAGSGDELRQGWWTIDGKTYYYDKNGNKVTGEQVIKGAKYSFGSDGALSSSSGSMGIDVSKWNGNINWAQVKNAGVNYAIIRCGYRGSSAGALIEDPKFRANIKGAQAAGIKVGVYFFSQAINEVEAVEEASMCINLCKGYNLSFPVYIDVEASHGRGDQISASQRTANVKAFCGTIQSAGYRAGVYSNKTWFTQYMNASSLTSYKIWLAQYAANVTYSATRYDMWQYTSKGSISGISGNVDMNINYN